MASTREQVVLASAARAPGAGGTVLSGDLAFATEAEHLLVLVNITANPGGADTVQVAVDIADPGGQGYATYALFTACTAATNALFTKILSPGTAYAGGGSNCESKAGPVPPRYRIRIIHSAATSHTYSVAVLNQ